MGFLQNFMSAPVAGSRGAAFAQGMSEMAPLLFSMAAGLREGKGAAAYAPQGIAAMMMQQNAEEDRKARAEQLAYSRGQDARMWGWRESERDRQDAAAAEENRLRADANSSLAQLLGGGASQYDAMAATGGPTNTAARMSALAPQIEQTAAAIGMSPVDLATIISYETGGTFNPTQAGPTTQWGQHRGLIQFGEPQARQYGVDWNDPVNSQLGANGAVARYFRENGWQQGMGMKDAYSIVNAGAPGRYSAKDEHVGGAPGTVAEKVDTQMAGHRRRAEAMFPNHGGQPRISPERAAAILSNPYATESARELVMQQFFPEEEKPQIVKGADGYNYWVAPGQQPQRVVPDAQLPPEPPADEYGRYVAEETKAGRQPLSRIDFAKAKQREYSIDVGADGGVSIREGGRAGDQGGGPLSTGGFIDAIDGALADPALDWSVGALNWTQVLPGTPMARFKTRVDQLSGQAFMQARQALKGGGQITDFEGSRAEAAIARLNDSQGPQDYRDALTELRSILVKAMQRERGWTDTSVGKIMNMSAAEIDGLGLENMTPEEREAARERLMQIARYEE